MQISGNSVGLPVVAIMAMWMGSISDFPARQESAWISPNRYVRTSCACHRSAKAIVASRSRHKAPGPWAAQARHPPMMSGAKPVAPHSLTQKDACSALPIIASSSIYHSNWSISCLLGRGITTFDTKKPLSLAIAAPASVAAKTSATSPVSTT